MAGRAQGWAAGGSLLVLAIGAAVAVAAPQSDRKVEIADGRGLYLECRGKGRPTVLLEAGLRSRGDYWSVRSEPDQARIVRDSVARFARVCEYDRPGTTLGADERSRSDPVPMPRTAADAVADLRALIRAAPIRGPLVLVGHSTGGLIQRLYAAEHPRRVVGMVQVDALSERIQREMTRRHFAKYYGLNSGTLPGLEDYPELEVIDFYRSFRQMRRAKRHAPPAEIPLIVISRGRKFGLPPELGERFIRDAERAWRSGQRMLARLPGARRWIAGRSRHYVMFDQPRMVIRAVRRVVEQARHG